MKKFLMLAVTMFMLGTNIVKVENDGKIGIKNYHTYCLQLNNSNVCVDSVGKKYQFTDRRGDEHEFTNCKLVASQSNSQSNVTTRRYECTSVYQGGAVPNMIGFVNKAFFVHILFEENWRLVAYGFLP